MQMQLYTDTCAACQTDLSKPIQGKTREALTFYALSFEPSIFDNYGKDLVDIVYLDVCCFICSQFVCHNCIDGSPLVFCTILTLAYHPLHIGFRVPVCWTASMHDGEMLLVHQS
jgi:hypothetical protein